MKINTVLATLCAVLLSMGFALSANAGAVADADGDGVPDAFDNCLNVPNGPVLATASCNGQEDNDGDGFGQPCDGDLDGDNIVLGTDLTVMFGLFGGANNAGDLNCDGTTLGTDITALFALFGSPPGP